MKNMRAVLVVDFGSQTTMLIARRIREFGVLAKVVPATITAAAVVDENPFAIVLSGGPASVLDEHSPRLDPAIFHLDIPLLGICYGMQLMVHHHGGHVARAAHREFGRRQISVAHASALFTDVDLSLTVWMSHSDQVNTEGTPFATIAQSATCPHAAIAWQERRMFGVQFHPEVSHGEHGTTILRNFVCGVAEASLNFNVADFMTETIDAIREQCAEHHVVMGLSGGVDSSVAALLIHRAIGKRLHCVYVNHGLHRLNEIEEVSALFGDLLQDELSIVDAREQFFAGLRGVVDPEAKRKIIGRIFIDVFEEEAKRFPLVRFLGQGTLYPDVIESSSTKNGVAHVIKSHHNVGGLPEHMNLKLLEPLRALFKDEVRKLGSLLGLPHHVVHRQPFPGPGLAVRIPGEVTIERTLTLQKADAIVRDEIERAQARGEIVGELWQWFAILLPVQSVGVMGDARSCGDTVVIRCVESIDAMTADWVHLPHALLAIISTRITNEVPGITRVLYDITQKPPGTIEWE